MDRPHALRRFLAPGPCEIGEAVTLGPDCSRHLSRVLRLARGDTVRVFTGEGEEFAARIESADPRAARLRVVARIEQAGGPAGELILGFAPPPGRRADVLIEKATEIGATQLQPIRAERLQGFQADSAGKRRARWRRKAEQAARQSGRTLVPQIDEPMSLEQFLAGAAGGLALIGADPSAAGLWHVLNEIDRAPATAVVAVGPAGGFTQRELNLAGEAGFRPVSLGPHVLRVETAALCLLSALMLRFTALSVGNGWRQRQ